MIVNNRESQSPENIIMIDDGTGINVAIPTIMISKEDGDKIKAAIKLTEEKNNDHSRKKEFVVLLVDFEMVFSNNSRIFKHSPNQMTE